jgi:peptide/nickel transport system permease protein
MTPQNSRIRHGITRITRFIPQNGKARWGLAILLIFIISSLAAPWLAPYDPDAMIGMPHEEPSAQHWLGTTRQGKDIVSQLLHGGRVSLAVSFGAGITSVFISLLFGLSAGYFGGKVDEFLVFIMNVVLLIPGLPLILVLAAFMERSGPLTIALIIGLTTWAWGARVIRSQTLSVKNRGYVTSAKILGEPTWRILVFEILPNLISLVVGAFIGATLYALVTEAGLEFIGLGDPSVVTWGTMLMWAQNSSAILAGAWWDLAAPCVAIALVGAALALLNFSIDEITNPRLKKTPAVRPAKPSEITSNVTRPASSKEVR